MNKDIIKVEIPVNTRFEFNRKKFAEYMCKNEEKGTKEYDLSYRACYEHPYEQDFNEEDILYMLKHNILVKLDEDEIDHEDISECLYVTINI